MKQLLTNFLVQKDENNPLWAKFFSWLNAKETARGNAPFLGGSSYYGCESIPCANNKPDQEKIISLEEWNAMVNPPAKEKPLNLIPFDRAKWEAGAKAVTRLGKEIPELTYFKTANKWKMVGPIDGKVQMWTEKGNWSDDSPENDLDLMLVAEPVKQYLNVYPNDLGAVYNTLADCTESKHHTAIGWLEVTITSEGAHAEYFPLS